MWKMWKLQKIPAHTRQKGRASEAFLNSTQQRKSIDLRLRSRVANYVGKENEKSNYPQRFPFEIYVWKYLFSQSPIHAPPKILVWRRVEV